MNDDQPRDKIGQFAATVHAEANISLGTTDVEHMPAGDMNGDDIRKWVSSRATHNLYPVMGWVQMDAADGKDISVHMDSFDKRVGRLADDVAERFASTPPGLAQRSDAEKLAREAIEDNLSPLIGELMKRPAPPSEDSSSTVTQWRIAARQAAEEIAKKVTGPAPVLDGFTAAEVEDHLAREQHERQCACDLKDDVCYTESYGEHWRHRMGVPDVEGIFDTIKEMAAARDAGKKAT